MPNGVPRGNTGGAKPRLLKEPGLKMGEPKPVGVLKAAQNVRKPAKLPW